MYYRNNNTAINVPKASVSQMHCTPAPTLRDLVRRRAPLDMVAGGVRLRTRGRPDPRAAQEHADVLSSPVFHNFVRPCAAEFFASLFYVFFSTLGTVIIHRAMELVAVALVQGACMFIFMTMFGYVSGGHVSPSITLCTLLSGGVQPVLALFYLACQFVGAFVGAVLVRVSLDRQLYLEIVGGMSYLTEDTQTSRSQAILLECVGTYCVCLAYLMTAVDTDGQCGTDAPHCVAGATFAAGVVNWRPTKASLNTAKSFCCACAFAIFAPEEVSWDYHYVYWIGPICGAALAAFSYKLLLAGDSQRLLFRRHADAKADNT